MIKTHFHNLAQVIIDNLKTAKTDIKIAVCWFTLPEIFDELLRKTESGVNIQIIINFDQLNFQSSGLPFIQLIEFGAKIYGYVGHGLLHHKFLVIDNQAVIAGSFNWTRSNHHDNLVEIESQTIANQFTSEWQKLLSFSKNIADLDKNQAKKISLAHLFQPTFWNFQDLRRNLIKGANLWTITMTDKPFGKLAKYPVWSRCLTQQIWYLPSCKNAADKAVEIEGTFNENIFQNIENEAIIKIKNFHHAKQFCKKCQFSDIVLVILNQEIIALGVVMSEPLYDEFVGLHCSIEWQLLEKF